MGITTNSIAMDRTVKLKMVIAASFTSGLLDKTVVIIV
jgi:hypothetical protein